MMVITWLVRGMVQLTGLMQGLMARLQLERQLNGLPSGRRLRRIPKMRPWAAAMNTSLDLPHHLLPSPATIKLRTRHHRRQGPALPPCLLPFLQLHIPTMRACTATLSPGLRLPNYFLCLVATKVYPYQRRSVSQFLVTMRLTRMQKCIPQTSPRS